MNPPPPARLLIFSNVIICIVAFVKTQNRTAGMENKDGAKCQNGNKSRSAKGTSTGVCVWHCRTDLSFSNHATCSANIPLSFPASPSI